MASVEHSGFSDSDDEGWEDNIPLSALSNVEERDQLQNEQESSSSEEENDQEMPRNLQEFSGKWTRQEPGASKCPPIVAFEEDIGIAPEIDKSTLKSVIDYFFLFFTMEFVTEIMNATNLYAAEVRNKETHKAEWEPVDVPTLNVFFCLCMIMGILDKPRMKDYWTRTIEIATPFFSAMLKRDRFMTILR